MYKNNWINVSKKISIDTIIFELHNLAKNSTGKNKNQITKAKNLLIDIYPNLIGYDYCSGNDPQFCENKRFFVDN